MTKQKQVSRANTFVRTYWQAGVVVGVLLLVVVVLVLKQTSPSTASPPEIAEAVSPASNVEPEAEVADSGSLAPAADESPHAHLDRMLTEGRPVFAFFHSTTCYQCTEMSKIVEQVFPDFEDQVALVDVNVYEERNQILLQQAGIRVIPTLIFFDRDGSAQGSTGILPADEFRATLEKLALGDAP